MLSYIHRYDGVAVEEFLKGIGFSIVEQYTSPKSIVFLLQK